MLAAVAEPATATLEFPVRDVLAAFATACSGAKDTAGNAATAAAAGWERLARHGERALRAGSPEAVTTTGGEYRKLVSGQTLDLAISGARANRVTPRGCRVYDFTAPRAPTLREPEHWAGRRAKSALAHRGVTKYRWSPGLKPGHATMPVIYASPGTRPMPGFDTGGLALIVSALEF